MPYKDREKQLAYWKEYNEKNKAKRNLQKKQWREMNKEKMEQYNKDYYENHNEYFKEVNKKWRDENPELTKIYAKEYYNNNKEKLLKRTKDNPKCQNYKKRIEDELELPYHIIQDYGIPTLREQTELLECIKIIYKIKKTETI